ncbi:hypothetical protein QTP88_001723 [Uroleucon formosanum]
MWCLLTQSDVPNPKDYTKEDLDKYKQILIETDSIYKNNDRSTGKAKSSGGDKYMRLISPIWKAIKGEKTPTTPTEILNPTIPDFPTIPITSSKPKNPTIPTTEILKPTILTTDILKPTIATENKGAGLMKYTNNEIEYCWIDNMKQINERLHLIAAEEKAGNYIYHNEKLGILKLFKKKMEHLIDDRKGIEYLLQFVINLPKEIPNDIEYVIKQLREKIYYISNEERLGNNIYHNDKIEILNFCIKKMEKVIDIPDKGPLYLCSFISSLPKKIIKGAGFFNDFLNCKFLPPMHYPKYKYLGPFTNLEKNEEQNIQPINELDKGAREHDYFYKNHKDTKSRHIADKILEQKALERYNDPNSSMSEKFPAFLTAYTMKEKRHLGMNLISYKNNTNVIFQIASNKIFKGENNYHLDKIQLDKLKNAKEKISGVSLEIRSSQIKNKKGGFLPLIFGGIGAATTLVGGVTSIVNTKKKKSKKSKKMNNFNKSSFIKNLEKKYIKIEPLNIHRSIGMRPCEVNKSNEDVVFHKLFSTKNKPKPKIKFKNYPLTLSLTSTNYQNESSDDKDSNNENCTISVSSHPFPKNDVKIKGELDICDLPHIDDLKISAECQPVGCIISVIDTTEYASCVLLSELIKIIETDALWKDNNKSPFELLNYSVDEAEKLLKNKDRKNVHNLQIKMMIQ